MTDIFGTLALLAAFLAPVLAFWWLYRQYLGWRRARAERLANPDPGLPVPDGQDSGALPDHVPGGHRMSFPIFQPLLVYPLLLAGVAWSGRRWWSGLFLGGYVVLLAVFTWEALSRKAFERARESDATLDRTTWVVNWLVPWVVLPLAVLAVLVVLAAG